MSTFKYVSFDLFDTLIFRLVNKPEAVFSFVEKELMKDGKMSGHKAYRNFAKRRIRAEQIARSNKTAEDICLSDIYRYYKGINSMEKKELMHFECEAEVRLSFPNRPMVELLNWCREQNKTVIIATDMYLDKGTIEKILEKNGIWQNVMYISGESGKTKYSGNLFMQILSDLTISKEALIHIGDNHVSDFEQPLKKGIEAVHYCENKKIIPFLEQYRTRSSLTDSVFANRLWRSVQYENTEYEIGYCALGPSLQEFCRYIHNKRMSEKLDKLWFVSREGYLIHQMYVTLYPDEEDICRYVQLNKNLFRKPFLDREPTIETFFMVAPSYETFSFEEVIALLGLKDKFGLGETGDILGISMDKKYSKSEMLLDETFRKAWSRCMKMCRESLAGQFSILKKYMDTIFSLGERVGLINNSINGSLQFLLEQYLSIEKKKGYFVGIQFIKSDECRKRKIHVNSWLEDMNCQRNDIAHFNRTCLMFEHLLFESNGTALYLKESASGVEVVSDEWGIEEKNRFVIETLQKGALDYCRESGKLADSKETRKMAARLYLDFIKRPSRKEAAVIAKLYDRDTDGERRLIPENASGNGIKLLKESRRNEVSWPVGYIILHGRGTLLVKLHNGIIWGKSLYSKL